MNKAALKKLATEAREELLERIQLQAMKLGITAETIRKATIESSDAIYIGEKQLSGIERRQRNKLIARINEIGFDQVMYEAAYTWFNRLIALRFMEVNDYLPTNIRVLSSSNMDSTEPDMMKEALSLDLDLDKEYVYKLKMENKTDELFKYLIKMHCNDLNQYMPFMFETIEDYTEILFPEGLLGVDSFVRKMTDTEYISEESWHKVEIIGWLYQYYISEEKDKIFADLKKNVKITKEKLPAATQLFTPNWIVRYMVENSLGRIWIESYPDSKLSNKFEYFLEEEKQDDKVIEQLKEIRYQNVNPEEVTFLDPCCGSGHILVYAFDIFYDMYLEKGYMENEIPQLILEKNLFGLDVDNRAVQLASFAVMMRARAKSRRIFKHSIRPNIYAIQESNWLTEDMINSIAEDNEQVATDLQALQIAFKDAREYGSLLTVSMISETPIKQCFENYISKETTLLELIDKQLVEERLLPLINQAVLLSKKYDVVCTNPPYMGRNGMNAYLTSYLNKHFEDSKADLFAAFIEQGLKITKQNGFSSMVTMQSWMFLSSYEKLRKKIIKTKSISTLLHMDNMVMGIAFGTSATVFRNSKINNYKGTFTEVAYKDINKDGRPVSFPISENRNGVLSSEEFSKIPGWPITYWVSDSTMKAFVQNKMLGEIAKPRIGLVTGDTERFLRLWFEVSNEDINFYSNNSEEAKKSRKRWFPYQKGGSYRKWYGNNDYVVDWENDGYRMIYDNSINGRVKSHNYNGDFAFKEAITWTKITSGLPAFRYVPNGYLFDDAGPLCSVENEQDMLPTLGLLNSKVGQFFLSLTNQTMNILPGNLIRIPYSDQLIKRRNEISDIVRKNINIAKKDWDSEETSWGFLKHPLIGLSKNNLRNAYEIWVDYQKDAILKVKEGEKKLNELLADIYSVQHDIITEVPENEITLRKPDLRRTILAFISYAIGCSLGRYSLEDDGIVYAGGQFDGKRYQMFPADNDNILPVLPFAYFEDDIVARFVDFVRITFSEDTLEENLDFVADSIGRRKNETARETLRRYLLNEYYKDHVQMYKKRPIYWLFTSGKEKAFNCLIYMHRYDKTTLSRIRTDYLHEVQTRMDAEKKDLVGIIQGNSTTKEINNAKKELKLLAKKIDELKAYDELLHHYADMQIEIDLNDGVKVNYNKFKGLLAKI